MLVQRVAAFVHGGEDAAELVLRVARGHPDVGRTERHGEGMLHRIDPPGILAEPEALEDDLLELLLRLEREVAAEE